MAAWTYKPTGFPTARFIITLLYLAIFTLVLLAILTDHASMVPEESNLVFLLAGALVGGWERIFTWWFNISNGEQPGGKIEQESDALEDHPYLKPHEKTDKPAASDPFAEANKNFAATKK